VYLHRCMSQMMGHFGKVTPQDALPFAEVYLTIPVVHFVFSAAGGAPCHIPINQKCVLAHENMYQKNEQK